MTHILREEVTRWSYKMSMAYAEAIKNKKNVLATVEGKKIVIPYTDENLLYWASKESISLAKITVDAKTIVFRSEQGRIFTKANKSYFDSLDYKLPFRHVFLQFDFPLVVDYEKRSDNDYDRGTLVAMALHQEEMTREEWLAQIKKGKEKERLDGIDNVRYLEDFEGDTVISNQICFLYGDWGTEYINWIGGNTQEWLNEIDDERKSAMQTWKNVAIACIGYVNCENIYLHRDDEVSESVNAKRERKGKNRLEPYYVCRIRGVQYDSAGNPTGEGAKHSIRYDVRGHFRRLTNAKTTWVRPHQRGLENELYIPKTYLVDKKVSA